MNFTISIWSFFLLIGTCQAIILVLLLLIKLKKNERGTLIIITLLLCFSVILVDHSIRLSPLFSNYPELLYISDALWYLLTPLMWLYIKVSLSKTIKWTDLLHLGPFVFFFVWYWDLLLSSPQTKLKIFEYYLSQGHQYSAQTKILILIMMLQMLSYLIYGILYLGNFRKKHNQQFSSNDIEKLNWLKGILIIFTLYFLFEFSFSTYRNYIGINNNFIENWSLVVWTIFLITFSISILNNPNLIGYQVKSLRKNGEIVTIENQQIEHLNNFMSSKKPYLNTDLSLHQLAVQISTSSHHLSYLLNQVLNISFYEYINNHRVHAVKEQLEEGKHGEYSIYGIAQANGFKSKASFYKFFKKEFGQTPTQFIKTRKLETKKKKTEYNGILL